MLSACPSPALHSPGRSWWCLAWNPGRPHSVWIAPMRWSLSPAWSRCTRTYAPCHTCSPVQLGSPERRLLCSRIPPDTRRWLSHKNNYWLLIKNTSHYGFPSLKINVSSKDVHSVAPWRSLAAGTWQRVLKSEKLHKYDVYRMSMPIFRAIGLIM